MREKKSNEMHVIIVQRGGLHHIFFPPPLSKTMLNFLFSSFSPSLGCSLLQSVANERDTSIRSSSSCTRTLLRSNKDHEKHRSTDATISDPPSCNQDCSNRFAYPTINWTHLRQKRMRTQIAQFLSTKFRTRDLTLSTLTTISNQTESYTYSDISTLGEHAQGISSCISPIHFPPTTYTISRLNSTAINQNDILFPIADCNLVIKHQPKRISRSSNTSKERVCI